MADNESGEYVKMSFRLYISYTDFHYMKDHLESK